MPLATPNLKAGLLAVMSSYPETIEQAAEGFAAAYAAYAQQGMFLAGIMTSLSSQQAAMKATLLTAMSSYGERTVYAAAWRDALTAFWVGVPISGTNSGATVGCPGASAAYSAILLSLESMPDSIDTAAGDLANALATATATVTATVSLPGPPFSIVTPIV